MTRKILTSLLLTFSLCTGYAQKETAYKTWNPAKDAQSSVAGQGWAKEVKGYYDRLPARAEQFVRKPVWDLSTNSAGIHIKFKTNANEVIVKYQVTGPLQMPHMPATGVSGLDLYAKGNKGQWLWAAGKYAFKDTVVYQFKELQSKEKINREYTLYLPLYNTVSWMEIAVPEESTFTPIPVSTQKPIVVYGTSIAQGGCASRPGLAWTSMLSRKLDQPLINLAFSGNGRLEKELIGLLPEIDAKMYILDCLPNLTDESYPDAVIKQKIEDAVMHLQSKKPGIPILLTEHDGYTDSGISQPRMTAYKRVNAVLKSTYVALKAKGLKNLYYLSEAEINQDIESMVDGTHPNDIGMLHYADAYEKVIRQIPVPIR